MTSLRILVPVKRVLDYAVKPRIAVSRKAVDNTGQKMSLNPFDELSIEASVRLREAHPERVTDILAFSAGPERSQESLRTALTMGAYHALLIDSTGAELEPLAVAKILRRMVEAKKVNLLILGKQAIDDDLPDAGRPARLGARHQGGRARPRRGRRCRAGMNPVKQRTLPRFG